MNLFGSRNVSWLIGHLLVRLDDKRNKAMLRTFLTTLATISILTTSSAVQAAPIGNGPAFQGSDYNGNAYNGIAYNSGAYNGDDYNGESYNGRAINGAEVRPGTLTVVGIKLPDGTTLQAK